MLKGQFLVLELLAGAEQVADELGLLDVDADWEECGCWTDLIPVSLLVSYH